MKSFDLDFTGPPKNASFWFSFFHFDDFLTTFAKDLMKKPTIFITNIKSTQNFLHFYKDLRSRNFWQWNNGIFFKKEKTDLILTNAERKKIEFSEFVKYGQKYFDSERLWYSKLSLLKLHVLELAILALKSLWKSIKLW